MGMKEHGSIGSICIEQPHCLQNVVTHCNILIHMHIIWKMDQENSWYDILEFQMINLLILLTNS